MEVLCPGLVFIADVAGAKKQGTGRAIFVAWAVYVLWLLPGRAGVATQGSGSAPEAAA